MPSLSQVLINPRNPSRRSRPASERVPADVELTGAVADDHRAREQAVAGYAAPQRVYGGDPRRLRQPARRATPFEMSPHATSSAKRRLGWHASLAMSDPARLYIA